MNLLLNEKIEILKECERLLLEKKRYYEQEIEYTQQEANKFKGAMESRYDTFKEELQDRKNHLLVRLNEILNNLVLIRRLQPITINNEIKLATIIETNQLIKVYYFIFPSFMSSPILIKEKQYRLLNLSTPLGMEFIGRKKGETIIFRNQKITIIDLY